MVSLNGVLHEDFHNMIKYSGIMFMGVFAVGATAATTPVAEVKTPEAASVVRQVDVGRQEVFKEGEKLVRRGNDFMIKEDYRKAIAEYLKAVEMVKPFHSGAKFRDLTKYCQQQIAICYMTLAEEAMAKADKLVTVMDFDAAIKICKEAMEYCPEKRDQLAKKIQFYETRRTAARSREEVSPEVLIPDHANQEYQIQLLIEQGRKLAKDQSLMKAKRKFEEVLLLDPYNAEAINNLRGVNRRIYNAGILRTKDNDKRATTEVEWKYAIPITADKDDVNNQLDERKAKNDDISPLMKKLQSIEISNINFQDIPLSSALQTLRDESRLNDKIDSKGVNIIMLPTSVAQAVSGTGETGEGGASGGAAPAQNQTANNTNNANNANNNEEGSEESSEETDNEVKVTLKIPRKSTLLSIFEDMKTHVKDGNGNHLDYRIDRNAVIVAPPGVPLDNMVTKFIPAEIDSSMSDANLKKALQANGVIFPNSNAKVFYDPELNHVVATNTPDQLEKIETFILNEYSEPTKMVQVMFKLIEISQNDLDELTFNWQVAVNNKANNPRRFSMGESSNSLLRYYTPGNSASGSGTHTENANLNFAWKDTTGTTLKAQLYALNQSDSSNVLSSPRITTLSGHPASVNMTVLHYYPEDYESIDGVSTDDYYINPMLSAPQPNLDQEEELGVKFNIKPEVVGDLIQMRINIPFTSFGGWMAYDSRISPTDAEDDSVEGEYYRKVIINNRSIDTDITVRDGATVVIGGVSGDKSDSILDKIPILGDLPFIGRLFQSRHTRSEKSNLLIFMTCRLIKPNGSALNPNYEAKTSDLGVPIFNSNQ